MEDDLGASNGWSHAGGKPRRAIGGKTMMRQLMKRFKRGGLGLVLAVATVLCWAGMARAQFPAYGGGGMAFGYPGWGYGGFYGYPGIGYGYGYGAIGLGYPGWGYGGSYAFPGIGSGYAGWGYGYPFSAAGYFGGFGYPMDYGFGYGNPGFFTPGLFNPLFGVGLTPLGAQSYMIETQLFGRRSAR
jgi:hypothetical protein